MQLHHTRLLLIFIILPVSFLAAQKSPNLGVPFISNFSKQTYRAGTQNWDFAQDDNGVIYIANNEGVLSYDGDNWKRYPLPNKTIVRSIAIDPRTQRLYVGGQDEVGYFEKDERGFLTFQSIRPLIPEKHRKLADVWAIFSAQEGVYFTSLENLYFFSGDSIQVHPRNHQFLFVNKWKDQVITMDQRERIYTLKHQPDLQSIGTFPYIPCDITSKENQLLVATEKNGLFLFSEKAGFTPWKTKADAFLKEKRITQILELHNQNIAVATALGGIVILNKAGYPVYWIDKKNGLQNNMVRSIFEDRDHNLWLGLDNGLDFLALADPITFFYPDGELEGTSYAIEIVYNELFIGTSNGLYRVPWKPYYNPLQDRSPFSKVSGSEGQVWGLNEINGQLFMGHHEGAFLLKDRQLSQLSDDVGYWLFLNHSMQADAIVAGSYNGLSWLKKDESDQWKFQFTFEGFNESSRFIVRSPNNEFWVSHPYRGVFKIRLDPETRTALPKLYGIKHGLPSETNNQAFRIWEDIVVCGKQGLFRYFPEKDHFRPYQALNQFLGEHQKVRRLFEAPDGDLWFITQDKVGHLRIKDRGLRKDIERYDIQGLHSMLMGGFELIYPFDHANVFMGAEKGVIHINPSELFDQEYHFNTLITEVHLIQEKDSLLSANQRVSSEANVLRLSPRDNSLRFSFCATNFSPFNKTSFQYKLEGNDEDWSIWSENTSREYTNLTPGKYTFKVRSGIPGVHVANTVSFTFYIDHPWYATPFAYGVYSFLFLASIIGLIWIPRRQFEKEKALLEQEKEQKVALHKAEVKQSREELMTLKNEKLNAEINHKNKELASTTMHLLQKSELIQKLRSELDKLNQVIEQKDIKKELKRIKGLLRDDALLDEEWEQFFYHFDQVHSHFFRRLKESYPQLTAKDQKLCAYLRMNLSSKEIAPLMNISVRGVEISRYRLRKKMDLDTEVNLNEFMMEF